MATPGESLAFLLRAGNAGSNTAANHITVLTAAIAQVPARHRHDLLITVDGAGATLDLIVHITGLNAAPGRRGPTGSGTGVRPEATSGHRC